MEIAAVFTDLRLGERVKQALYGHGVATNLHQGPFELVQRRPHIWDALVVEDDGHHLGAWLTLLGAKLSAPTPILAFGPGDPLAMTQALEAGAVDYATWSEGLPSLWRRLAARATYARRMRARLHWEIGELTVDRINNVASCRGEHIQLTVRETDVLLVLAQRANQVVSTETLCLHVFRRGQDTSHRAVEQHVYRLRRKLGALLERLQAPGLLRLTSVYAVGYRLDLPQCAQVLPDDVSRSMALSATSEN